MKDNVVNVSKNSLMVQYLAETLIEGIKLPVFQSRAPPFDPDFVITSKKPQIIPK